MTYQKDNGTTVGVQDSGESVLLEAQRLTHGPRNADYGHPLDDYSKNAGAINALFKHKLREDFTAADVALIMVVVKLSRQVNRPKRDNMVDAAGYAWVANACIEETERRAEMARLNAEPIYSKLNAAIDEERAKCASILNTPPPDGADGLARALHWVDLQVAKDASSQRDGLLKPLRPADLAEYATEPAPRALPSEKPSRR